MITKTVAITAKTENWDFTFYETDKEIRVARFGECVGFMNMDELEAITELKKAIDDLA